MAQFAQKRKEVVLGEVEPTESECEWEHDETEPEDEKIKIESIDETKSNQPEAAQPMETMPADAVSHTYKSYH